jgi:hypothetical protein
MAFAQLTYRESLRDIEDALGKLLSVSFGDLSGRSVTEDEMAEAASNQVVGRTEWKRRFDFGLAYILIPPNEVNKAINCIQFSRTGPLAGCEPYVKLKYVWFISIPIFNKGHTRALVAISRVCGGVCGDGGVLVYRKTADGWELELGSFAQCRWVS